MNAASRTSREPLVDLAMHQRLEHRLGLRWRQIQTVTMACLMLPVLSGCAVTGSYPPDWPEPAKGNLVGLCPPIAGKFSNAGTAHPKDAGPLSLTRLLDLPDGEQVEITQSPDRIEVTVWTAGTRSETVTFTNGEVALGWDMSQPRTFACPINIPSGRILLFSHLEKNTDSVGGVGGILAAGGKDVRFANAADGSLIVNIMEGAGVLVGFVPIGWTDRVYYRFEPVDP
jgi:hypothetical protein